VRTHKEREAISLQNCGMSLSEKMHFFPLLSSSMLDLALLLKCNVYGSLRDTEIDEGLKKIVASLLCLGTSEHVEQV